MSKFLFFSKNRSIVYVLANCELSYPSHVLFLPLPLHLFESHYLMYQLGVGGVGKHFISQLAHVSKNYPNLSLILISRTTKCLFTEDFAHTISLDTWESDLENSKQPVLDLPGILVYLDTAPGKCILVDNTSNQEIAESYPSFLKHGISIVTPNKKAFSDTLGLWRDIFTAASSPQNPSGGLIYHESSVGAGLPVISTLRDLVETGDEVVKIEGVFSGTMSFLFNSFAPVEGQGGKWSAEVRKAQELGFTEPDPRDDLNGLDVARKLVILARIAGLDVEGTNAFPVQSLIPKELEAVASGGEFLERLGEFDAGMDRLREDAQDEGKVIRFVGSVDVRSKEVKVGLEKFEKGHPIAALKGSDNIINFYTKRYGSNPLIIQGSGYVMSVLPLLSSVVQSQDRSMEETNLTFDQSLVRAGL
jgi:homoserine dehydrogenase